MTAAIRTAVLLTAAGLFAPAPPAVAADPAGEGVTIRNDTGRVVVVQSSQSENGLFRRGKPIRLLPGETVRLPHASAPLKVEVFEGQTPMKALYTGSLTVRPGGQAFRVGGDDRAVLVSPVASR